MPSLRTLKAYARFLKVLGVVKRKGLIRVCHDSLQSSHFHLLTEAHDKAALSAGMHSLSVRMAKGLNEVWERKGPAIGDRYPVQVLEKPTRVRRAIVYVLQNCREHGRYIQWIDPLSGGVRFDGWLEEEWIDRDGGFEATRELELAAVSAPETWLLRVGWMRAGGRISLLEEPEQA